MNILITLGRILLALLPFIKEVFAQSNPDTRRTLSTIILVIGILASIFGYIVYDANASRSIAELKLQRLEINYDDLKEDVRLANTRIDNYQSIVHDKQRNIDQLNEHLREAYKTIAKLRDVNAGLQDELNQMRHTLNDTEYKLREISKKYAVEVKDDE